MPVQNNNLLGLSSFAFILLYVIQRTQKNKEQILDSFINACRPGTIFQKVPAWFKCSFLE